MLAGQSRINCLNKESLTINNEVRMD